VLLADPRFGRSPGPGGEERAMTFWIELLLVLAAIYLASAAVESPSA
jgi:hypothetical protein